MPHYFIDEHAARPHLRPDDAIRKFRYDLKDHDTGPKYQDFHTILWNLLVFYRVSRPIAQEMYCFDGLTAGPLATGASQSKDSLVDHMPSSGLNEMTSTFAVLNSFRRMLQGSSVSRRRSSLPRTGRAALESLESRLLLTNPLTALPMLNSLPGASVSIYLDFNGHTEADTSWTRFNNNNAIVTPVFDIDGDRTTFSNEELRQIEEIWYRTSEDFMPFQVNVTTVEPASISDFQAIRVVIGGNGSWRPGAGGVALLNSFSQPSSNTVFAFSELFNRPHDLASVVSHEAGHAFGLNHHSQWAPDGTKVDEYSRGTPRRAPIMGVGYYSERDVWDNGPGNVSANQRQDDLALLTRPQNQTFRFRADDHGNSINTATTLLVNTEIVSATGIIGQNDDVDMFRFDTNTGPVSFSVEGLNLRNIYGNQNLTYGTNLDAVLRLYDQNGTLIIEDNPANSLFASVTATVSAGTYYVAVAGTGEYGSLGQYTLSGTVIPLPTTPLMLGPTGMLTQPVPFFEWTPGANAAHYELQVDNLTTGAEAFYVRSVTTTSHLAEFQFIQSDFRARVRTVAVDGTASSWSNYINFTIDIPAPVQPTLTRPLGEIATSFPTFIWTDQAVAVSHTLWVVSLDTGARTIYRTNYQGTSYQHFSPLEDGNYEAWVQSFNSVGESSPWSDSVQFSIQSPAPGRAVIVSPQQLTTDINPRISWEYDGEAWKYDLWIDYRNTGTSQFIRNEAIIGANYLDLTNLPQGTYNAWVRVINGNNQVGPWSSLYSFTVDVLPPERPTMTGPTAPAGTVIETLTPTFTWTAAELAVTYDLWVNNETTGQIQIIRETAVTGTSFTALTSLTEGNYRAWVRGVNSAGEVGLWSVPISFKLDQPAPARPVFTAPTLNPAGSVTTPTPAFSWTADANAYRYEFQIDTLNPFQAKTIYVNQLTTNSYTVPENQSLRETTYRAWVRAFNAAGEASPWSAEFRFRIDIPNPTTPQIIGPEGTVNTRTPTFQWIHSSGSTLYEILVRDLERQEDIVLRVSSFTVNPANDVASYTVPANQALRNGTYRFWIRAFNSQGTASAWSASRTFAVTLAANSVLPKTGETAALEAGRTAVLAAIRRDDFRQSDIVSEPADVAQVSDVPLNSDGSNSPSYPKYQQQPNSAVFGSGATAVGAMDDDSAIEEIMARLADPADAFQDANRDSDFSATATSNELSVQKSTIKTAVVASLLPLSFRRRKQTEI